ncbi:MAG: bifunctional metallophosphatase/5'-nucleotidase [Nitriliruptorales bacterium]|nr:bifunctional metallophosphatase/5'-nucleotidase [Nitriliruptorales bacterium]
MTLDHRAARAARTPVVALSALALLIAMALPGQARPDERVDFWLTVIHSNDGESRLIPTDDDPGVARFATLVDRLRREARTGPPPAGERGAKRGAIVVSSGDNFLAGAQFNASLDKGVPFYDAIALELIGYDAFTIGNHEFDFGPDILADFIESFSSPVPFLSANLDVSAEPRLQELEGSRIVPSTVAKERGERIGIIGAVTPRLPAISSPRDVKVLEDVAGLVQAEIDRLSAQGVDKIVVSTHLQNINEEITVLRDLRGVDVVISGGGSERLDPYPLLAPDADGNQIPVVTTVGDYGDLGRLVMGFNRSGDVVSISARSQLFDVTTDLPVDRRVQAQVVEPVEAYVADLAATTVATSEVLLNGDRGQVDPETGDVTVAGVRNSETNLGSLMGDALLETGRNEAPEFGVVPPVVAIQNGGGIRASAGPGDVTLLDTFNVAAFSNFVSVVPGVTGSDLLALLEHGVAAVEVNDGRFSQVAGMRFSFDRSFPAGERIRELTLSEGDIPIVVDGALVDPDRVIPLATNDFTARDGDGYPFEALGLTEFTTVGVTYQQSLADYLTETLGGSVTAADYPEGGLGRITRIGP